MSKETKEAKTTENIKKPDNAKAQEIQKKNNNLKYIFAGITVGLVVAVTVAAFAKTSRNSDTDSPNNSTTAQGDEVIFLKNATLGDVIQTPGKVNVYFFWGDGCPHCRAEYEFFESIKEEYGKYYNLYGFEVWHSEDNANLLNEMAAALGQTTSGVPVTIIGDKVFTGFGSGREEDIKKAIESEHQNSYDVYFDKIK